jgi:small-conductance mechanosensitive channel
MLTLLYFRGGSPVAAAVAVAAPSGGGGKSYYEKRRRSLKEQIDQLLEHLGEEELEEAAREVVAEQVKADTPLVRMRAPDFKAQRAELAELRQQLADLQARALDDEDEEILLLAA